MGCHEKLTIKIWFYNEILRLITDTNCNLSNRQRLMRRLMEKINGKINDRLMKRLTKKINEKD